MNTVVLTASLVGWLSGVLTALIIIRVTWRAPQPAPVPAGSRLEAMGALAAGIVHEIAQPLSAARVSLEGMHYLRQLGREPSLEQTMRTMDRVGMNLLTMTQIVDHLRFLAGGQQQAQLKLHLDAAIADLIRDRETWLRWSNVRIDFHRSKSQVLIYADPTGLRLVLANLIRNGVEAVAGLPADRCWVSVSVNEHGVVEVSDPGPGLPPEVASHLFEPFVSTRGEARGVGLSLARAAAERMGGTLVHVPRPGGGTSFQLTLVTAKSSTLARHHVQAS